MNNEEKMWRMTKYSQIVVLESIAVSLMAMVLIFGLGFIFPSINPYLVVKWIVYVTAVYFVWSVPGNWVRRLIMWRMMKKMKSGVSMEVRTKKVSKKSK
jgi:hypothetical protein